MATTKDIVDRAGVAPSTVSYAPTGPRQVSDHTRRRTFPAQHPDRRRGAASATTTRADGMTPHAHAPTDGEATVTATACASRDVWSQFLREVGKNAREHHKARDPTDHARPRRGLGRAGADRDDVHRRICLGAADNEGHAGYLATKIAAQRQLPGWLSATHPDIVIMHLGTNDVWSNIPPAAILAAFSTLVDQMRASNRSMKILVAQILPMHPSNCQPCAQRVLNLDAAIPAWAKSKSTTQSPITVVDQWTGFNDATDTIDGVHPNNSGNQKMAAKWFGPLAQALGGAARSPRPVWS